MGWDEVGQSEEFEVAYGLLQRVASRYLRSSEPLTLQTTSLVHEAYLKLAARSSVTLRGVGHAKALMARAMRQVLIDHVRRRNTEKHGPPSIRISFDDTEVVAETGSALDIEVVHQALTRLEREDPSAVRVLELAYFGGYRQAELAEILGVSDRTVRTRLQKAQESLGRYLGTPG